MSATGLFNGQYAATACVHKRTHKKRPCQGPFLKLHGRINSQKYNEGQFASANVK
jgi:hypothetical protein